MLFFVNHVVYCLHEACKFYFCNVLSNVKNENRKREKRMSEADIIKFFGQSDGWLFILGFALPAFVIGLLFIRSNMFFASLGFAALQTIIGSFLFYQVHAVFWAFHDLTGAILPVLIKIIPETNPAFFSLLLPPAFYSIVTSFAVFLILARIKTKKTNLQQ